MKNKLKTIGLILTCMFFTSCGSTTPIDTTDIDQLLTGMVQNMQSDMNIVPQTVNTDGSK